MFAIVDIETTGGSPQYDKITEISILIHDGLSVVDKFTTLINPERRIPYNITRLTGISDDMVENAPRFYEVAKKIIEYTEGRIFVAHNVSFDYNFIAQEYKALGYEWKREKLCTVKLSRKLIPGKVSYSLGKLCDSLGIGIEARHRAEGDAVATAKLFDLLLARKNEHPTYRRHDISEINTTRIDKIKTYILKKLPEETGVYYFLDREGNIIYIGKSNNVRDRAFAHFNGKEKHAKKMLSELFNVDFVPTGSELLALLMESEEIKKHKPKYNRVRKGAEFTHSIDTFVSDAGIVSFRIVPFGEAILPLASFATYATALHRINELVETHTLCLNHVGLNEDGGRCFFHHVKRCNGICNDEETAELYNQRAQKIVQDLSYERSDFILMDRGRRVDEQVLIMVENGRYAGFGFIDNSQQVSDIETLKSYIAPADYYPDADTMIRGWLRRKKGKVIFLA